MIKPSNIWYAFFQRQFWIVICSWLSLTSGCTQAESYSRYDGTMAVRYYRNNPEDVITLQIPKGYVDYLVTGGLPDEPVETHLFFVAEATTFAARSSSNKAAFEYPNAVVQGLRFSIATMAMAPPDERSERIQRNLMNPFHMWRRPCIKPNQLSERFGLERHSAEPTSCPKQGPDGRDDILIERTTDSEAKTVITCTPDDVLDTTEQIRLGRETSYAPRCAQSFYLSELNSKITIHYARELNKNWREIQQRISSLLISFVQKQAIR